MANRCNDINCKYRNQCWFCHSDDHPACKCPGNPVRLRDRPPPRGGRFGRGRGGNYGGFNPRTYNDYSQPSSQPPNGPPNQPNTTDSSSSQPPQSKSNRTRFNKSSQ